MTFAFLIDSVDFTRATRDGLTSLGGSESACVGLARALKARGHDVHVFATRLAVDAAGVDAAGVLWHPAEQFQSINTWIEWDVVIALRMTWWFNAPMYARMRLLWNQDLLLPGGGAAVMAVAWALDHVVYVSEYHRRQWEGLESPLRPIGWVTRNGYDPAHVPSDVTKDPFRIIHVSRPERGLTPLLAMWPALRARVPDATLQICRYSSMYDPQGWGAICASYDEDVTRVNAAVGGITYLGELAKPALYKAIAESAVMWYPGVHDFAETSCIAALEAQACGTPFVGSYRGALPETVPSGRLIKGDALSPAYQEESISAVVGYLEGCRGMSFGYRAAQKAGRSHVKAYTFDVLAAEWEAQIEHWFSERYEAHKVGVLRQLLHEDDHVAAKQVAQDLLDDKGVQADVEGLEAFTARALCDRVIAGLEQSADDYAAHAVQDPVYEAQHSTRFGAVLPNFADRTRVLDVACGNGAFAIAIALAYPAVHVHGLDYAAANITAAQEAAARAGVADRCRFTPLTVYDFERQTLHEEWHAWTALAKEMGQDFDGLFVGEFLEHCANTSALIDGLEVVLEEDARVIYTCPSGPFGDLLQRGQPILRGHVHSIKQDDIKTVFGPKQSAGADYLDCGFSPRTAPIGHWLIHYRVAHGRTAGQRDLLNRARRTRPFQKLSVGLIVYNGELDLARCLHSIWAIADEIVIGDTGSTDATRAIAEQYGARVIDVAPVSEQVEGFSGARNAVLEACTGDWFLWIDADELLVGAPLVRPYLDATVFHGYVIHQNHLYLDAPPTFDIPVRLFRCGQDIRFYGCVHEQPQMGDANTDIFPTLQPQDLQIAHTGYLTNDVREAKRTTRNLPLIAKDQEVFPDRLLGKVILMREAVLQADADVARRGEVTVVAQGRYAQALRIFLERFTDPGHKFHSIARPWYEQALKGLGLGWEMEIALAGKRGPLERSHAKPERVWVRDLAEFDAIIRHKLKGMGEKMTPRPLLTDPDQVTTAGLTAAADGAQLTKWLTGGPAALAPPHVKPAAPVEVSV